MFISGKTIPHDELLNCLKGHDHNALTAWNSSTTLTLLPHTLTPAHSGKNEFSSSAYLEYFELWLVGRPSSSVPWSQCFMGSGFDREFWQKVLQTYLSDIMTGHMTGLFTSLTPHCQGTLFAYGAVCFGCLWRRYVGPDSSGQSAPALHQYCIILLEMTILALGW